MKYGVHIHAFGKYAAPALIVTLAREAEDAGWDGVFVNDHLAAHWDGQPQPVASPWIVLAAIAAVTSRVALGPLVTPLPRRRPWQLAAECVTLDQLAGGRLILGVGSGAGLAESFAPYGEPLDARVRAEMLDEGLAILAGLWSGEPFRWSGRHYQLDEVIARPRPVQIPRIPIWVAGHWPHRRPFRRAARWDGLFADIVGVDWMQGQLIEPTDLPPIVAYVRQQRADETPFEVVIGGHLPNDRVQARERLAAYAAAGLTWWIEGIHEAFGPLEQQRERIRQGPPRP